MLVSPVPMLPPPPPPPRAGDSLSPPRERSPRGACWAKTFHVWVCTRLPLHAGEAQERAERTPVPRPCLWEPRPHMLHQAHLWQQQSRPGLRAALCEPSPVPCQDPAGRPRPPSRHRLSRTCPLFPQLTAPHVAQQADRPLPPTCSPTVSLCSAPLQLLRHPQATHPSAPALPTAPAGPG